MGSIPFCCASPSGALAEMPCSGENKDIILKPACISAVLESIPVLVVAASFVTSPIDLVFHAGFCRIISSTPKQIIGFQF